MTGIRPEEREGMRCLLEQLGGPGKMAEAMKAAGEGHFTDLPRAGAKCGLDMGPALGQAPARTSPAPTATMEAPTVVSTTAPATATSTPVPTGAAPTTTLVITVAPIPAGIPGYDRDDWKHWVDEDGDCQDARQEVLVEESLDQVTFETDRECRVEAGRWYGFFDGHDLGNTDFLDVDHMVPLKNAHLAGAWAWSSEKKEMYANYLEDDGHLIAVASRANRQKGDRGPEDWKLHDETYWCRYATDWTEIKERWDPTMTEPEAEAVVEMLGTCDAPAEVDVRTALGSRMGVHKPTTEPEGTVYSSCEEASEAGEQRVEGSHGAGEGIPGRIGPQRQGRRRGWGGM